MLDGLKPRPRSVTPSLCTLPRHFTTTKDLIGLCAISSDSKHTPKLMTVTPTALVPAFLLSHGCCMFSASGHSSSGWTVAQASPSRLLSKVTFPARGVVGGGGLYCATVVVIPTTNTTLKSLIQQIYPFHPKIWQKIKSTRSKILSNQLATKLVHVIFCSPNSVNIF